MRGALITIALILPLVGCTANDVSIFRHFDTGGTKVTAVDAKQRFLITVAPDDKIKFCAEPSPDALSAISSSLATSLSVGLTGQGEGAAGIASSLQEAATQIGKRNATVQLFRDGWYRLCEGSLNDDISGSTYTLLATKYADSTVVWLAIEELAGLTVSSAAVSGSGGTTASTSTAIGSAATQSPTAPQSESSVVDASEDDSSTEDANKQAGKSNTNNGASQGLFHLASIFAQADAPADSAAEADAADQPSESETGDSPSESTEDTQSDEPQRGASATSNAGAGAPVVAPVVSIGRAPNPSEIVAKAAAFIVSEYLHRARFNDCLLALDNVSIDLGSGGLPNMAMDATVAACEEVIKGQAGSTNRMLVELLASAPSGTTPE